MRKSKQQVAATTLNSYLHTASGAPVPGVLQRNTIFVKRPYDSIVAVNLPSVLTFQKIPDREINKVIRRIFWQTHIDGGVRLSQSNSCLNELTWS